MRPVRNVFQKLSRTEQRREGVVAYLWYGVSLFQTMDEGSEGDKTSREGGLPTLPGLYHSTIQPSQRGFFRVHMFV
jgi:hypothetical protein